MFLSIFESQKLMPLIRSAVVTWKIPRLEIGEIGKFEGNDGNVYKINSI